jgi:hypothetical protein
VQKGKLKKEARKGEGNDVKAFEIGKCKCKEKK